MRLQPTFLPVFLVAIAVAGCLENPGGLGAGERFQASGTSPVVFFGHDYGGANPFVTEGRVEIDVVDAANTGKAIAIFRLGGQNVTVRITEFAQLKPTHDGGIRNGFQEHGATGNGDALLPEFHALSAGWGYGTVALANRTLADPATGEERFELHYMVTDEGVRDPETHTITKSDGTTPYDPQTPGDGRTLNASQIMFEVKGAASPQEWSETHEASVAAGEPHEAAYPIPVAAIDASIAVNVTLDNPTLPLTGGFLSFTLRDPTSEAVGRLSFGPASTQAEGAIETRPPSIPGNYTLEADGFGLETRYEARLAVSYPERPLLHVVYHNVTIGPRGEASA